MATELDLEQEDLRPGLACPGSSADLNPTQSSGVLILGGLSLQRGLASQPDIEARSLW